MFVGRWNCNCADTHSRSPLYTASYTGTCLKFDAEVQKLLLVLRWNGAILGEPALGKPFAGALGTGTRKTHVVPDDLILSSHPLYVKSNGQ
jgi:hypothetical protein